MDELLVVTTGGTIDKLYFDEASRYEVGEPQIGRILEELGVAFRFRLLAVLRKDSLHITPADRASIRTAIVRSPERRVLITHGTDTMVETAKLLLELTDRTIVLTGALNPARFSGSDAVFNIGTAVGALACAAPGVYIAMNGRLWDPRAVRKNVARGCFEAVVD